MDRGDDKIAPLIADLEKSDKPTLRKTVDALIRIAGDDPQIGLTLSELLNDPSRENRWPIAYVLASLPSPPQSSVQVLSETLDHRDPDIRWAVALILIRLAKTDRQVLELLINLASKGTANQRRMAIYSLRGVGLNDEESVQALMDALRDSDPTVRVAAVTSLKMHSGLSESGKNELLQLFSKDQDLRVRNIAAITLAQLGNPSDEFLSELTKATASENAQLKKAASAAVDILKKRSAPSGS
ncbi:MAG TPA: HEAT repeat domain-containing protein [Candidatus Binatia bacterium]|nr:HEAT repeat domain-containing protein [Candidatus Binatia bacterium]